MVEETRLVVKKANRFDKIRKVLIEIFFHQEEYLLEMKLDNILKSNRVKPEKIVIPKEINGEKYKKLSFR